MIFDGEDIIGGQFYIIFHLGVGARAIVCGCACLCWCFVWITFLEHWHYSHDICFVFPSVDLDFSFLEMNPFTLVNGEPYPLDMRGELDDTAAFKNFKKWAFSSFPRWETCLLCLLDSKLTYNFFLKTTLLWGYLILYMYASGGIT